ncbi:MAG: T9SS type A sorting domain-containing protein, partial [Candidatus Saccharibacteria bacterium]|nr:T9SS type A sorting domain-containing protein [Candidatus Saccharibacteria bacterium]
GGPNIDQLEFDVAGIVLAADSSIVDSDEEEGAGAGEGSGDDPAVKPGDESGSTDKPGDTPEAIASPVQFNAASMAQVQVFDLMGHRVATFAAEYDGSMSSLKSHISGLPNGIYMIRARVNGHTVQSRMNLH